MTENGGHSERGIFSLERWFQTVRGGGEEELPLLSSLELSEAPGCGGRRHAGGGSASAAAETIQHPLNRDAAAPKAASAVPNGDGRMSPLEQRKDLSEQQQQGGSGGTVRQTSLNIAKTCMGSGTLALPYAAGRSGLLFNLVGLGLISLWNLYSVDRLLRCLDLIPRSGKGDGGDDEEGRGAEAGRTDYGGAGARSAAAPAVPPMAREPPPGTATYGRVAFYALGPMGLRVLDSIMMILLLGVVVAFEDAIISFLRPTPLSTGSATLDALWTVLVIAPLSCVPDMGYLGKFSASGIAAVLATFAVIFWYGISENGLSGFGMLGWEDLWPRGGPWGLDGVSSWFGVAAFGYGNVPITYNFQESMRDPAMMPRAAEMAMMLVFLVYAVIGDGVAILYRPSTGPEGLRGDVLQELPVGWMPTSIRLAMTFVVIVTAPLLVVPCAQLVEGKLGIGAEDSGGSEAEEGGGSGIKNESGATGGSDRRRVTVLRVAIRFGICLFCTGISVLVPGFVNVLSFVGAFCVSMTSFVFPPLLHLTLLRRKHVKEEECMHRSAGGSLCSAGRETPVFKTGDWKGEEDGAAVSMRMAEQRRTIDVDTVLLIWGILATAVTSFLTFGDMFNLHHSG